MSTEIFTYLVAALAPLGLLFGVVKTLFELGTLSNTAGRNQYELAHSLAQRASDATLASYAQELGCKILVNDANLTTAQRMALLTLPNRSRAIPRYLKSRQLLTVRPTGPVLSWKFPRHSHRWYRNTCKVILIGLYAIMASLGFCTLLITFPKTSSVLLDGFLAMPTPISVACIVIAAVSLFHALKIDTAEQLVAIAQHVGPNLP